MQKLFPALLLFSLLSACIGDDFVDDFVQPTLRITTIVDSITIDSSFQFSASFFNNVGAEEAVAIGWSSSDENVVSIDLTGLAVAHTFGPATITATYDDGTTPLRQEVDIHTSENPVLPPVLQSRPGELMTTSSYNMTGNFTVTETTEGGLLIEVAENYETDDVLPGLYVYLSNNPNSIAQAYEIGAVDVFEGAHTYEITETIGINDFTHLLYFCKPFNIDVGSGVFNE